MPDKEGMRTIAVAGFCLALLVWNWHYMAAPAHRAMTLLVLATVFSGAVFYELTMRDAPMEWVLAGIFGVLALAVSSWLFLQVFTTPLANDHAPLLPARPSGIASSCPMPRGGMQIILGGKHVVAHGAGPITPFRVGVCSGPSVTRTARGLLVNAFGYDDDGTVIYRVRDNQFDLLQGEYLHLHRTDPSTLAIYDKSEREVLYLRYLAPGAVRIRGRFLCGQANTVTISEDELSTVNGSVPLPACLPLKAPLNLEAH